MEKLSYRFPKEQRLHHRSLVEHLFLKGKTFYEFPFRVSWCLLSEEDLAGKFRDRTPSGIGKLQMMVTVPKKKRKRAVDRVLMRRRIREAYRLNKNQLEMALALQESVRTLSLAFVYIHNKNLDYKEVEEKIILSLGKILNKIVTGHDKLE